MEFVEIQGGNIDEIKLADNLVPIKSSHEGILVDISAEVIGKVALNLGGGRIKKGARIDYGVGIVINKHIGDHIRPGDILCYLYTNDSVDRFEEVKSAFTIVK